MKRTALALACATLIAACSSSQDAAEPGRLPRSPRRSHRPPRRRPSHRRNPASTCNTSTTPRARRTTSIVTSTASGSTTIEIPADKAHYGTGTIVFDTIQENLHALVDDAAAGKISRHECRHEEDRRPVRQLHGRSRARDARRQAAGRAFARIDAIDRQPRAYPAQIARPQPQRQERSRRTAWRRIRPVGVVDPPGQPRRDQVRRRPASRAASACPIATITSRTTTPSSRACAPTTASTSRRCCRWPATHRPRPMPTRFSSSRPRSPRRSGTRSRCAIRSRRTTRSRSAKLGELAPGIDWDAFLDVASASRARSTASSSASRPT